MKRRVLVIGMDSAPLELLVPWMSKGHLPSLAKIFNTGSYGNLYSRIPVTPIAWSSIYTGKNPGKHGILGFRNHRAGSYTDVGVNATMRDGNDVWDIAGAHGKKVVVVNTPLTYPPHPVNGFLVCGFMAPSAEYGFTYPSSLSEELRQVVPNYRIGTAPNYIKSLYLKELNSTVRMVGNAAKYLMSKIDWDLSFVVFKETDEVQHSFYDKPGAMLTVYQRVDEVTSEFLENAGEDAYVLLVSDHGGEPIDKRFNVAEFLRQNSLISLNDAPMEKSANLFRLLAQTMFGMHMQWILDIPGARRALSHLMKARAKSASSNSDDGFYGGKIDWAGTTAFIASGIGLRINVKGRKRKGLL
ncbi:MAG: alkaline phosphatase family protein, partial [Thaumarchaeota archaeon]|nr:alkaline phosphatase family protein [Nitrososphaerota archaeon]